MWRSSFFTLQITRTQKESSLSDLLRRANLYDSLWATHLLHTKEISVHIWWQPGKPWGPLNVTLRKWLPASLSVEQPKGAFPRENKQETWKTSFFFLAFPPNLCLLSCLVLRRQNTLDVRLPEVRATLDPTVLFWARFEGHNLFHVADTWHCHWITGEIIGTRREKDLKMQMIFFKLKCIRCLCHIALLLFSQSHNIMKSNVILGVLIWQSKKILSWKKFTISTYHPS